METINNRIKLCGLLDKKYSFDRLLISRLPRMLAVLGRKSDEKLMLEFPYNLSEHIHKARRPDVLAGVRMRANMYEDMCTVCGLACCVQFNIRPPVSRCVMRWVARYFIESVEFSGIAQSATAGRMLAANHLDFTGLSLSPARLRILSTAKEFS